MDPVSSTTAGQTTSTTSGTSSASASAAAATADYETFLTLLTAQLKNQDPLKPLESTEFVAQLASFSAVEQQVRTNDALTAIQDLLGGSSPSGLASWIGAHVQVLKDPDFSGSPIDVMIAPAADAKRAELVVQDTNGNEIQRLSVPLKTDVISWAGVGEDGTPLANGTYQLLLESFNDEELIDSHQAPIYEEVREARLEHGSTLLILRDGSALPSDQVTAIRGS